MAKRLLNNTRAATAPGGRGSYSFVHQEDLKSSDTQIKAYIDQSIQSLSSSIASTYATQTSVANSLATKPSYDYLANSLVNSVGWTGKNLLPPNPTKSQSSMGIVFTTNADGSVLVNGTSQDIVVYRWTISLEPGLYRISSNSNIFKTNEESNTNFIAIFTIDTGGYIPITNGILTVESGMDTQFTIRVASGQTINNELVYPMIRLASDPDTTYEPYHATVANELAGKLSNTYSTSEEVIGTWVDGRPIYRRTITGTVNTYTLEDQYNMFYTSTVASNVDLIISSEGCYKPNTSNGPISINSQILNTDTKTVNTTPYIYISSGHALKALIAADTSTTSVDYALTISYVKLTS